MCCPSGERGQFTQRVSVAKSPYISQSPSGGRRQLDQFRERARVSLALCDVWKNAVFGGN